MKEQDIRPQDLFNQYLTIATADIKTFFGSAAYYRTACPACDSNCTSLDFRKLGFDYERCADCGTLFVNPRPEASAFDRYYREAPSVRFWATDFYRQTAEARREAIFAPRADKVLGLAKKYSLEQSPSCFIDIGAGYGVFSEEIGKRTEGMPVIAIEPSVDLADVCVSRGLEVINEFLEDVDTGNLPAEGVRVATSFELLEHVHSPLGFIESCGRVVGPGGLLILTTLNGLGFDLVILGENSKSIHPPHHLNFFNPDSLAILLERTGFEVLEVTTPGKLDVDIAIKQKEVIRDSFAKLVLEADEMIRNNFQLFLQTNNLSSHMMAVARRLR